MLNQTALRGLIGLIVLLALTACAGSSTADVESGVVVQDIPTSTPVPVDEVQPTDETPTETDEATEEAVPTTEPSPAETTEGEVPSSADVTSLAIAVVPFASGLTLPVGMANAADGSNRLFVVEKQGTIRILDSAGDLQPTPFLDIRDRVGSGGSEQGLLGLAFHPNYTENGHFYVNYTNETGNTVISRFNVTDDPNVADPNSEMMMFRLPQPASNHNGGGLVFGPDGYLYIGTGDGGAAGDRYGNGQNTQTLLGAMLRVDVDGGTPYAIPADNPFVDDPNVLDEIWAYGLRNPWRYSFDRLTGDLFIADVGQNAFEEVHFQPADSTGGQNYGWPIMEGYNCFPAGTNCDQTGLTLPILEYSHSLGCSITGGYIYRGDTHPAMQGVYIFGDFCSGRIWGLAQDAQGSWQQALLTQVNLQIAAFGEAEDGSIYVVDIRDGGIWEVTAQ
ncbi:MAG: glucose dehydrogenase [Chloroflexi bacterium]|nr:glucose dehydrogenase [Chloroflexota bacterium]